MRKVKKLAGSYTSGIRSDHNGPTQYAIINGYTGTVGQPPKDQRYKVVKPYTRFDFMAAPARSVPILLANSVPFVIERPSIDKILLEYDLGLWLQELEPLFSTLNVSAHNSAIEKSIAYEQLMLAVSAVEAKKTVIMIRSVFVTLFQGLLKLYKSIKKLDVRATYDTLSNLWLEARYGWRPLIGELGTIHKMLTSDKVTGILSAYGVKKHDGSYDEPHDYPPAIVVHNDLSYKYKVVINDIDEVTSKAGFNYLNTEGSRNDSLMSQLGLDINSILTTGWELVPFSFVIDFFFNIGSMLQAQNVSDQVDSFNYWTTNRFQGKLELRLESVSAVGEGEPFPLTLDLSHHLGPTANPDYWSNFYTSMQRYAGSKAEDLIGTPLFTVPVEDLFDKNGYPCDLADNIIKLNRPSTTWKQLDWQGVLVKKEATCYAVFANGRTSTRVHSFNRLLPMFGPSTSIGEVQSWYRSNSVDVTDKLRPLWAECNSILPALELKYREWLYSPDPAKRYEANKIIAPELFRLRKLYGSVSTAFTVDEDGTVRNLRRIFSWGKSFSTLTVSPSQKLLLSHKTDFQFLNRRKQNGFNHSATSDTDLSSGQWTDLAIFGEMLGSAIMKKLKS